MIQIAKKIACLALLGIAASFGQNLCPRFLLDSAMVVNIEGRFINIQHSRASVDIEWRHHPEALDTFFVNLPDQAPYRFITAGSYRYMELTEPKAKRQLGLHHLKEYIGSTPLRLDDMELLANGSFLCKDSTDKNPKTFATAFSNMWWSLTADTLPQPQEVTMKGAGKEVRTFTIGSWKEFSGIILPTLITLKSEKYSGSLWIRSAYPVSALKKDPLAQKTKAYTPGEYKGLFGKVTTKGERDIPLILKLNKELLGE